MKKIKTLLIFALFLTASCSDATRSAISAWGQKHKVSLYSGGKQIGQWTTTGKIENESGSNGYYFRDEVTGKIILIDGDIIIELTNQ